MKWFRAISIYFVLTSILFCEDFLRELPDEKLISVLTPETFKNLDAVIILKEQSYKIEYDETYYRGVDIYGPSTTYTKVLIAKLFNESAVTRYGSFEFEYYEQYGDEIPNGFEARARVLKPDGTIWIMEEDEIQKIISRETNSGRPLSKKILFKIPNLAISDVVQIEFTFTRQLATSASDVFYYNDRDFVLYSNLYITLPANVGSRYINFPGERIGKPKVQQISQSFGSGKTYFWVLKNLYPIPVEPYSAPFEDQSLMTAFVIEKVKENYHEIEMGTWAHITAEFYENYIDEDDIDEEHFAFIGVKEDLPVDSVSNEYINGLYTKIREKFKLQPYTSLYPLSDDIDSIFEKQEGDASDLSYIMYKILKQWKADAKIVWLRDKRQGKYEITVPSKIWFDRLGVLVKLNGKETLFDFDNCIPYKYSMPWYLKKHHVLVLGSDFLEHKVCQERLSLNENVYAENHIISIDSMLNLNDKIQMQYSGAPANKFRAKYYNYSKNQIETQLEELALQYCIDKCDSLGVNDFLYDPEINITMNGSSLSKPEEIDSFLIFKIKNHSYEELYNTIYTTLRNNNYVFEGPFKIIVFWEINIPDGYTLHKKYPDKIFPVVGQLSAKITRSLFSQKYNISANFKVKNEFLSYKNHVNLISLLENIKKELDQDIILKKL